MTIVLREVLGTLWITALLALTATASRGAGALRYQNPEEQAMGLRGAPGVLAFVLQSPSSQQHRSFIEIGQRQLFAIDGLNIDCIRAGYVRRPVGVAATAAVLSSTAGGEKVFGIETWYQRPDRIAVSGELTLHAVSINGYEGSRLFSATLRMAVRLRDRITLVSSIDDVRLAGERQRGAGTSIHLVAAPAGPWMTAASLRIDRSGRVSLHAATRMQLGRSLHAAFGYEDTSGMFKGALSLHLAPIGISAGASVHPVLGVSRSMFLSWGGDR
jgi:hypothetical protein